MPLNSFTTWTAYVQIPYYVRKIPPYLFKVYPNIVIPTDTHGNPEWLGLSHFPSSRVQEWVTHLFCAFSEAIFTNSLRGSQCTLPTSSQPSQTAGPPWLTWITQGPGDNASWDHPRIPVLYL